MDRILIRPLRAWNAAAEAAVLLEAGTVVHSCRIHPNGYCGADRVLEPYVVTFRLAGTLCACPLFLFQSRTQALVTAAQSLAECEAMAL